MMNDRVRRRHNTMAEEFSFPVPHRMLLPSNVAIVVLDDKGVPGLFVLRFVSAADAAGNYKVITSGIDEAALVSAHVEWRNCLEGRFLADHPGASELSEWVGNATFGRRRLARSRMCSEDCAKFDAFLRSNIESDRSNDILREALEMSMKVPDRFARDVMIDAYAMELVVRFGGVTDRWPLYAVRVFTALKTGSIELLTKEIRESTYWTILMQIAYETSTRRNEVSWESACGLGACWLQIPEGGVGASK
jgi:hypothetical protein